MPSRKIFANSQLSRSFFTIALISTVAGPFASAQATGGGMAKSAPVSALETTGTQPTVTYYFDSQLGLDSNPGTQSLPKQHLSAIPSLAPGQSVALKRGGIWRELLNISSSGESGEPILFTAYGSGASPIISGSDLVQTGWTRDSTYIWKAKVVTRPNIVYFNNVLGSASASKSSLSASSNWTWSAGVLYVWSPADINPSQYFTSPGVEAGARNRALQTNNASYVTIDSLTFRDGNATYDTTAAIGFSSVVGMAISNCVVERGASSGISTGGDDISASVQINNCIIRNNGGWGIYFDNQFAKATVSGNQIYGNGWRSVLDAQEYDGIEGALGNADISGNVVYSNSPVCVEAAYCHGIYADAATAPVNIHGNTIYGQLTGGAIKTRGSANIYNNRIYGNSAEGLQVGGNESTNIRVAVWANQIYQNDNCNCAAGILELESGPGSVQLSIQNNTTYENGSINQAELKINDNLQMLVLENNIFVATPGRRTVSIVTPQTHQVTIDHNLHWRVDGLPNILFNDNDTSWKAWQAMGFDKHSPGPADPLFKSAPTDLSLQPASPATATGMVIPGVTAIALPNIGAE